MASRVGKKVKELTIDAPAGSWSWLKEYTGYAVTILPYISAGIVLIPQLNIWVKAAILFVFVVVVLAIRVLHEKAGIEVTSTDERKKRP